MSWVEKIETQLLIITGDGNTYSPLWKSPMMSVDYNVSEFNFPNLEGTLVSRKKPRGRKYNLDIYFQGEDNIEQAKAFEVSARDSRAWTISHPIYGKVIVQPIGLSIDYTPINVSAITGSMIETITDENPIITTNAYDFVIQSKEIADNAFAVSFSGNSNISSQALTRLTTNNEASYLTNIKSITNTVEADEYRNRYNEAQTKILNFTQEPLLAMQAVNNFINYPPTLLTIPLQVRLSDIYTQLDYLATVAETITDTANKILYENNGGVLIGTLALASVIFNPNSYKTKSGVLNVIDKIITYYNTYIATLALFQSSNYNTTSSYLPDYDSLTKLNNLINYTLSNLFSIASDAKQERSVYLEEDSNVILLTHRFYGIDADGETIEYLMESNGWGLNQVLGIPKGTKVLYYI